MYSPLSIFLPNAFMVDLKRYRYLMSKDHKTDSDILELSKMTDITIY